MHKMSNEQCAMIAKETGNYCDIWARVERLCYKIACAYYNTKAERCKAAGVTLEDLKQESFFGVVDAVKDFDETSGFLFASFLSFHMRNRFNNLCGLRTSRQRGEPLNNCASLDEPIGEGEDNTTLGALIEDISALDAFDDLFLEAANESLTGAIRAVLQRMPENYRRVIVMRYFAGLSFKQAAKLTGESEADTFATYKKAMRWLRHRPNIKEINKLLADDCYFSLGTSGTGFKAFKYTGTSATERAAILINEKGIERTAL